MALGELTKQIAREALLSAASKEPAAPVPPGAENSGPVILSQIAAMQKALKEDEELVVLFHQGAERIRVLEIFVPSWQVAVLTGPDADRNLARVISPFASLQLICKTVKVAAGAKPARVNLITPKPKDA